MKDGQYVRVKPDLMLDRFMSIFAGMLGWLRYDPNTGIYWVRGFRFVRDELEVVYACLPQEHSR